MALTFDHHFLDEFSDSFCLNGIDGVILSEVLVHETLSTSKLDGSMKLGVFRKCSVHFSASYDHVDHIVHAAREACRSAQMGSVSIVVSDSERNEDFYF